MHLYRGVPLAPLLALALLLNAGCTDAPAPPAPPAPDAEAPDAPPLQLFEGSAPWPTTPGSSNNLEFDVPQGLSSLLLYFNWRGQQPGGYSSLRAAVVVDADGHETEILGVDLPFNPYACASSTCGPAEERLTRFDDPTPGEWRLELRGAYTATATLRGEGVFAA